MKKYLLMILLFESETIEVSTATLKIPVLGEGGFAAFVE